MGTDHHRSGDRLTTIYWVYSHRCLCGSSHQDGSPCPMYQGDQCWPICLSCSWTTCISTTQHAWGDHFRLGSKGHLASSGHNSFQILGMDLRLSTAFHSQTDGQCEVTIHVLENFLWPYVELHPHVWSKRLSIAKFTANNAINVSTGYTSIFLEQQGESNISRASCDLPLGQPQIRQ